MKEFDREPLNERYRNDAVPPTISVWWSADFGQQPTTQFISSPIVMHRVVRLDPL
jgi:hypothetical protein